MTRVPCVFSKADSPFPREVKVFDSTIGWRFTNPKMTMAYAKEGMGDTAENVAQKYGLSRLEQDEFALASQKKWAAAHAAGRFSDELVPVVIPKRKAARARRRKCGRGI